MYILYFHLMDTDYKVGGRSLMCVHEPSYGGMVISRNVWIVPGTVEP